MSGTDRMPPDHFSRLWPVPRDMPADAPHFLLLVLPVRVLALGLLWMTAAPGRFVSALGLVALLALLVVLA
jgi:hypothetical protein